MNSYLRGFIALLFATSFTVFAPANADEFAEQLLQLQQDWAVANYQLADAAQEDAFSALEQRVTHFVSNYPSRAEAHIWQGIILSTEAGVIGGLAALDLAKRSKVALEHALSIDPQALDGSAHTSLGTLYFKVPGWPFGFGNDDLAKKHLEQALILNPEGIDPNFFYGEFLYEEGDYKAAAVHLNKALAAAPRPQRELADRERRKEIQQLLTKVEKS